MTLTEVDQAMWPAGYFSAIRPPNWHPHPTFSYFTQPDWLGNHRQTTVTFDTSTEQVTGWEVEPLPRMTPRWLDCGKRNLWVGKPPDAVA